TCRATRNASGPNSTRGRDFPLRVTAAFATTMAVRYPATLPKRRSSLWVLSLGTGARCRHARSGTGAGNSTAGVKGYGAKRSEEFVSRKWFHYLGGHSLMYGNQCRLGCSRLKTESRAAHA